MVSDIFYLLVGFVYDFSVVTLMNLIAGVATLGIIEGLPRLCFQICA
jgi:hypothetical protein